MPCSFGIMFVQCASTKWFVHFVRLCLHQMGGGADDLWTLSCLLNVTVFMVGKWQESHRWFISSVLCVQFHIGSSSVNVSSSAIYFWCIWQDLVYGLDDGNGLWESWSMSSVICVLNEHCSYISSYVCSVSDCGWQMPLCVRLCALPPLWLRSACLVRY